MCFVVILISPQYLFVHVCRNKEIILLSKNVSETVHAGLMNVSIVCTTTFLFCVFMFLSGSKV